MENRQISKIDRKTGERASEKKKKARERSVKERKWTNAGILVSLVMKHADNVRKTFCQTVAIGEQRVRYERN